jgi:hypothetical protein
MDIPSGALSYRRSIFSPIPAIAQAATLARQPAVLEFFKMDTPPRIYAVTVNHGTSQFVELMLRTLFLTNDLAGLDFEMTVLDNQSADPHADSLRTYLSEQRIALVQTGFDTGVAAEKHGAALANFIRDRPECTHYLFLDADIWFMEPDTLSTMLDELRGAPGAPFANQARIHGYYAGRVIEGCEGIPGARAADGQPPQSATFGERSYIQTIVPRCSPVCSLVANTSEFRRVVETLGLAPAYRFGVESVAFHDTFSLMTQVMATHGQPFIVSSKTIQHFTQAAYMPEHRAVKDRDCGLLLNELRAGRGATHPSFIESEWVRQQRQQPIGGEYESSN